MPENFSSTATLTVFPVKNGWVVRRTDWLDREGVKAEAMVARTPDELAEILRAWASQPAENVTGPI